MSIVHKMENGALVFMDALGFKGIWKRKDVADDPTVVIRKLEVVEQETRENFQSRPEMASDEQRQRMQDAVKLAFISDTVVIAVADTILPTLIELFGTGDDYDKHLPELVLNAASVYAAAVIGRMARSPAPLPMRGSIAWGPFSVSPRFIVGPAVDEAAECAAQADAAIVWLAPSALKHARPRDIGVLVPWTVPMKNGAVFRTRAVSPFAIPLASKEPSLGDRILDAFDAPRLDVQIKRQNTEAFLAKAKELSEARQRAPSG